MRSLETTNFYKPETQMPIHTALRQFVTEVIEAVPGAIKSDRNSRWSLGEFGLLSNPPQIYLELCAHLCSNDLLLLRRR